MFVLLYFWHQLLSRKPKCNSCFKTTFLNLSIPYTIYKPFQWFKIVQASNKYVRYQHFHALKKKLIEMVHKVLICLDCVIKKLVTLWMILINKYRFAYEKQIWIDGLEYTREGGPKFTKYNIPIFLLTLVNIYNIYVVDI